MSTSGFSFGNTTSGMLGSLQNSAISTSGTFGMRTITTPGVSLRSLSSFPPTIGLSTTQQLTLGSSGTATSTSTALNNFNLTNSTLTGVGLGGIVSTQTKSGIVITQKEIAPKEQPLPNEILQTVEQFKELVKQQKLYSSDIARCSVRDFRRVEQEIDLLNSLLNVLESQLQKNRHVAENLKYDTAKCLHDIEIAQRTQDTPPGLQYENIAPLRHFLNLVDQFEKEMQALKIQIESADKYVKNHKNPDVLTAQDLALGMKRLHETFVALAGRLQSVHSQVESQKEIYLNIRKQIYSDSSNPFEKLNKSAMIDVNTLRNGIIYSSPRAASGPTPFNNSLLANENFLTYQQNKPPTAYPGRSNSTLSGNQILHGPQIIGRTTANTSFSGGLPLSQSCFGITTNFQLQKPPSGNKRGKQ